MTAAIERQIAAAKASGVAQEPRAHPTKGKTQPDERAPRKTNKSAAMKKPSPPAVKKCCYCHKSYDPTKGKGLGCAPCWEARWRVYAAEDARMYYTSPLAGIND